MNKEQIEKVRIDIVCDGQSTLSMLLARDGRISRQGTAALPADEFAVMGENDGSIFRALVDGLDERLFDHAGVYEHPDKAGLPITYSVAFLGEGGAVAPFEFRLGTETAEVGELLPFIVQLISHTVRATDDWYKAEKGMAGLADGGAVGRESDEK